MCVSHVCLINSSDKNRWSRRNKMIRSCSQSSQITFYHYNYASSIFYDARWLETTVAEEKLHQMHHEIHFDTWSRRSPHHVIYIIWRSIFARECYFSTRMQPHTCGTIMDSVARAATRYGKVEFSIHSFSHLMQRRLPIMVFPPNTKVGHSVEPMRNKSLIRARLERKGEKEDREEQKA